jgi:hypothetical protein
LNVHVYDIEKWIKLSIQHSALMQAGDGNRLGFGVKGEIHGPYDALSRMQEEHSF